MIHIDNIKSKGLSKKKKLATLSFVKISKTVDAERSDYKEAEDDAE